MRASSRAVIIALVATGCALAPAANAQAVEVRMESVADATLEAELLQVEPRMGQDLELFFRIQNLSQERLETMEVQIEQRDARGRVRAYYSFTHQANVDPGREFFLAHQTKELKPRKNDLFLVQVVPSRNPFGSPAGGAEAGENGLLEKQYFSGCITFCDRCAEKAVALCGSGGVSEYTCECTETTSSCRFKCAV